MELSSEEAKFWEPRISECGDVEIIRRFFSRLGQSEKVKKVLENEVRKLAEYDILLQGKYEKGYFQPELTREEVRAIARSTLEEDIAKEDVGNVFSKLSYPVFKMDIPDEKMKPLVNKAIREGRRGYELGKDPVSFAKGLIECPVMHECPEEVEFAYRVFSEKRYTPMVEPELARNIVTLKVFHNLLLSNFSAASKVRGEHPDNYDEGLLKRLVSSLVTNENFGESYGSEYLRTSLRSQWKGVFPDVTIEPAKKKSKEAAKVPDEEVLKKAFDDAEGEFTRLSGIRKLKRLLGSKSFVGRFGRERLKQVLEQRVERALRKGNASEVYEMFYGYTFHLSDGEKRHMGGVKALPEYVVAPDKMALLEKMVKAIRYTPRVLMSDKYSFRNDNLSCESEDIENAYALAQTLLSEGRAPSPRIMQDVILMKIAAHAKKTYEGAGAKNAVSVYTAHQNRPFIKEEKVGKLMHKVLKGLEEKFVPGHMLSSECVSYCFTLVDSPLGKLVEDAPVLKPYVKLRDFLSQKQ